METSLVCDTCHIPAAPEQVEGGSCFKYTHGGFGTTPCPGKIITTTKKNVDRIRDDKLISHFMGVSWAVITDTDMNSTSYVIDQEKTQRFGEPTPVGYHTSMDALLPVILKIDDLGYDIDINSGFRRINITLSDAGLSDGMPNYYDEFRGNSSLYAEYTPIECVATAIATFLAWYNGISIGTES
jgi:hypothetical protein